MNRKKFTLDLLDSSEDVIRLRWNLTPSTLVETLSKLDLPFIVQAEKTRNWPYNDRCFDWCQPLLVYRQTCGVKVYAQVIEETKAESETEEEVILRKPQLLVIPIECQGWFEFVGRRLEEGNSVVTENHANTGNRDERSTTCWDTLAKVIAVMPSSFLSIYSLKVLVLISESKDDPCYEKSILPPFSELHVVGILEDLVTYVKNKQTESKVMRCLECRDNYGRSILVPAETQGWFFATELKKGCRVRQSRSLPKASKLRKLVTEEELPIYVRILSAPDNEYIPASGIVEIYELNTENTIMGCNVSSEGNSMFELPASAEIHFHSSQENVLTSKNPYVRKALSYVKDKIDSFQKSIKVRTALHNSPKFTHIVETPM
ncbi:hypothetical protein Ahia01_000266800 [Argonauta hians]